MSFDRNLGAALHHQLASVLRSQILAGRYLCGDMLPSEDTLRSTYGLSRTTVRRALLTLTQDGLIEPLQGRGTRVLWNSVGPYEERSISAKIERIQQIDRISELAKLKVETVPCPPTIAEALGIAAREPVLQVTRLRHRSTAPLWLITAYFTPLVASTLVPEQIRGQSIFELLELAGTPCSHADEFVSATLTDVENAALLGVRIGSPALEFVRVMFDAQDRPLAFQVSLAPPERCRFRTRVNATERTRPEIAANG